MRVLENLRIRSKFLLLPAIATVLMALLGALFLSAQQEESQLLEQINAQDVPKMRELSRLFSEFSTNHVKFINLLATSLRDGVGEGDIYAQGRKNIIGVNRTIQALNELNASYRLDETQQGIFERLLNRLVEYRDQMGSTVLMSSVELKLITEFTLRANSAYDAANTEFLSFIDAVEAGAQTGFSQVQTTVEQNRVQFFVVLGTAIVLLVIISTMLANRFSLDLRSTIERLSKLAQGDTSITPVEYIRRDEFGAVDQAIEVFREALIERDRVEEDLNHEIERRVDVERSLRISEERFRALYEDNPLILITVDEDGTVLSINRRGASQIGFEANELIGSSVLNLVMEEDRGDALNMIQACAKAPGTRHQRTLRKSHKDGNVIWLRETGQAINEGKHSVMLLACEDITETHKLSERLAYQATHDRLTGLVNRWEFERRLGRMLNIAKRDHTEHILCYIDLDQFKLINDTCGHPAGDELLKQLAAMLKSHIDPSDTLARLGGDEFGLLLEKRDVSSAWRSGKELLRVIEEFQFPWSKRVFRIGASIGLVQINEMSNDVTGVMADADAACYTAKDEGRNRIHIYSSDDATLALRRGEMEWATRLPEALEQGRFELFYQPIAPLQDGLAEHQHMELLIRLRDESGALVTPSRFLPAAERYHMSTRVDRWVVSSAFDSMAQLRASHGKSYLCGINLSGHSLANEDFLDFVLEQFEASAISPESVCFEITETAAITNLARAQHFMSRLKEKGAKFALDDFGTGLSSFAYLRNLPVDMLKIDGIFVRDIARDPIQFAMVRSISDMGHILGMQIIAEFVEDAEIAKRLREIGVDYAQGYYIARPRPLSDLLKENKTA